MQTSLAFTYKSTYGDYLWGQTLPHIPIFLLWYHLPWWVHSSYGFLWSNSGSAEFHTLYIHVFMYFISYSLRAGRKVHLFLLYLETYPSWPVPILWVLALAKHTSHIWSQTSVGCLKSMASCPWQLNSKTRKDGHWESLEKSSVRLQDKKSHKHMQCFFKNWLQVPQSLKTQTLWSHHGCTCSISHCEHHYII